MARTTLDIDEQALAAVMKAAKARTKTEAVNVALREYTRRLGLMEFLVLEGKVQWQGDLDELRRRRPRRK